MIQKLPFIANDISARYVHPSDEVVLDAISRLGGHKFGHSENAPLLTDETTNAQPFEQ